MVCVMDLILWEFFNVQKKCIMWLSLVSALYVLASFFSSSSPFLHVLCKDVRKLNGRYFHTLAPPPHASTNSCHIWFCGIWYFEQNDFLIFHSNIIINFTIENSVHVQHWLLLISNAWGSRGKCWKAVLSERRVSHQILTILSCLGQGTSRSPLTLAAGLVCVDLRKY